MKLIYGFCWEWWYNACFSCFYYMLMHYTILCCCVHTILLIKCLFRCFCVYFWTPSSTKFWDSHISIFGTTNDYVFHTLPLAWFHTSYMHTFSYDAHTHTHNLWHVVWLMLWLYHALMLASHVNFLELLFKFQFLGFNS